MSSWAFWRMRLDNTRIPHWAARRVISRSWGTALRSDCHWERCWGLSTRLQVSMTAPRWESKKGFWTGLQTVQRRARG
ncbi:hypothetical protein EON64_01800 [archaeon]|nr:MAG: hypothetical protein EON64_01800 [archaeon]